MKQKKSHLIVSWLAVVAVAAVIFLFSAQDAEQSSDVSHGLLMQIRNLCADLFDVPCSTGFLFRTSLSLDCLIRKLAHFFIYTVLGFCCVNACYQTFSSSKRSFVLAFLFGSFYAVTDEIHQFFVPGRSCQLTDVLLDSCGVACGLLLFGMGLIVLKKNKTARNFCKKLQKF